jgi:hypothetical protein
LVQVQDQAVQNLKFSELELKLEPHELELPSEEHIRAVYDTT